MKNIVEKYNVGCVADPDKEDEILNAIEGIFGNPDLLEKYKQNCNTAAAELNWQKEFEKLKPLLD